mmetsp:Transcript_13633/g.30989  ORF Transcript_13633/g.30989 Transcript_13633/m.30989 type:complete len:1989 (-) Transcript_13633:86-6052(-)
MSLKVFEIDPTLQGVQGQIWDRVNGYKWWKTELEKNEGGFDKFAEGYKIFGFNRTEDNNGYIYREWLPNAKQVFLVGEFNNWENSMSLSSEGFGRWAVTLPDNADGTPKIPHRSQLKVRIECNDGQWIERVPAWAKLAWQDHTTNLFNGVFWEPPIEDRYKFKHPRPVKPENLKVYEAHVGMSSSFPIVATYTDFADNVLPRIKRMGYNCVQLMACAEHAHYGCFGYHVTSFFAPAGRSGTPEELKYLVDTAHSLGIVVLMDLVHAHASSNSLDGIAMMDGTDHCYTHGGAKGHHSEWDSKIFHVLKYEVLRFLLSNVRWWLEEYGFDGFRFDGITSMLYHSHGIGKGYTGGYHEYFGPDADIESHIYLMLANDLIHSLVPTAITVGEDVSGMPTLCLPVDYGGFGFDYRLAMAIPDMFIKLLKESTDDAWDMGYIVHTLTNRRWKEKCVGYVESHDQAIVGDKTIAFWLMDAEMYTGMSTIQSPTPSMCIDRGLSLHKMIRLLVLGLGGEGYLNFMGNEFGHPEWIDFPRPENGWSHQHCRRRWDLADEDHLRYHFFQNFDELMQAAENRWPWLSSEHQYVCLKSECDKVIAFERGELLFVLNFHPCQSFSDYQIGMKWGEPMRCILDTDEGRFGGHMRLEYGHSNTFPVQGEAHTRPHSCKMYLPARTGQVLIRESLLQGGVSLGLDKTFMEYHGINSAGELSIQVGDEAPKKFSMDGSMKLCDGHNTEFKVVGKNGEEIPCRASPDGKYRIYFPGVYSLKGMGYIEHGQAAKEIQGPKISSPTLVTLSGTRGPRSRSVPKAEKQDSPQSSPAAPAADRSVDQAPPQQQHQRAPQPHMSMPTPPPAPVPVVQQMPQPQLEREVPEERRDAREMVRNYSGLHLFSFDDDEDEQPQAPLGREPSQPGDERNLRTRKYEEAMQTVGRSMKDFAKSYTYFGLQPGLGDVWTFREWVPEAKAVYLIGEFNNWDRNAHPLKVSATNPDVWCCEIKPPMSKGLQSGTKYKLCVEPTEGETYYPSSAWSTRFVYTEDMKILDPVVSVVPAPTKKRGVPKPKQGERIYECHLGLVSKENSAPSFKEAAATLLPRVARNGYTTILLIGVQECKEYASMGQQPVTLFAPAKDLGTPADLQDFIAQAHQLGLRVLLSLAHDGVAPCGDGVGAQYLAGNDGFHPTTGSRSFQYELPHVLRYLLSNLAYWMQEYCFDGFRFQNVSSMLYTSHGYFTPESPEEQDEYFGTEGNMNRGAITYLMMANKLVHELNPECTTIADEFTGYPGVCEEVSKGGLGFDMRQGTSSAKTFHTMMTARKDEEWSIGELVSAVIADKNKFPNEKLVQGMETSEDTVLGRRPLRIAMLSWETLHTIAAGGVAPHVTELAAALHEAGHEIHIFTRGTQMHTWEHTVWGVNYHEVSFGTSPDFVNEIENMCSAFVGRLCHVEGHIGTFDIIHGHDWLVGPAVVALKAMGKRCVFTMHSTETGRCGNVQYAGQSARIRDIEGRACHVADRVIAVSGVLKQEVCNHYNVHGAKVEVIYNGIHAQGIASMEWHDEWSGNTKRDKGFSPMDPMFLFVGRLAVQKGPDLLIEAIPDILRERGDAKFLIVGDGHMKAQLVSRVNQLGIGHAVHFAGSVKSGSAHLKALFKTCDAVIVPSRNEPFGIVVLEAWAAGKPVVATTCGGPRDFVKADREGFLVDPNPGSIAWGCKQICMNFQHAAWMGKQAKVKALGEFSWSHISRQTMQVYYEQMCLHGAPHCRLRGTGCPLASHLLGPHQDQMGVMTESILTTRGLSYLKLLRLLTGCLGSDATLTWMGSEFGSTEAIDMPRAANGHKSARIPYEKADEKGLKYKHLEMFEMCLNKLEAKLHWLAASNQNVLVEDERAKVLACNRGNCVFVFNFHPTEKHTSYKVPARQGVTLPSALKLALSTDEVRFGGASKADGKATFKGSNLAVDLPPRTALVLVSSDAYPSIAADQALHLEAVDDFVDQIRVEQVLGA